MSSQMKRQVLYIHQPRDGTAVSVCHPVVDATDDSSTLKSINHVRVIRDSPASTRALLSGCAESVCKITILSRPNSVIVVKMSAPCVVFFADRIRVKTYSSPCRRQQAPHKQK